MSLQVALSHRFDGLAIDVAFEAPRGITVLFGPSGSGKTTIVNAVAGLLCPDAGRIAVGGHVLFDGAARVNLPARKRGLGYIFQDHRLFPHLSVADNLRYGARFAAPGGAVLPEARVVEMLGIGGLMARMPAALSGGEKARVAIGRALLARPRLILADEPLAALDDRRKGEILPYFERLAGEVEVPILYVSHAAGEVARLATTVVALAEGRVQRAGPALDVLSDPMVTPAGIRAAGAVIEARLVAQHEDGLSELDAGGVPIFLPRVNAPEGSLLRVRIAAQDVLLAVERPGGLSALNVIPGRVVSIRSGEGPGAMVALDTACGRLLARITRRSVAALGLGEGASVQAVVKTVSVAREDIGS